MSFKHLSFRAKMTLAVSSMVAIFMLVTTVATLTYFESEFEKSLTTTQASTLKFLAEDLDATLVRSQESLLANAAIVTPDILANPKAAQTFLASRTGLKKLFNLQLMLVDQNGRPIASYPSIDTEPANLAKYDFFKKTISTGRPQISDPVTCCPDKRDYQIVFTAPIKDPTDRTIGALVASFSLYQKNILSRFTETKIGKNGFVRIINKDKLLVIHPNKERIMLKAAPGALDAIDRAMLGGTVTTRHDNFTNDPLITSMQRLRTKDWVLASSYPVSEAYAPIKKARTYFILATFAGLAASIILVFAGMRILTSPLRALTDHVNSLPEKTGSDRFFHNEISGEVGRLTDAFNGMVMELENRNQALLVSEERYRIVADFTADFSFWIRPDDSLAYVSPACLTVTGYSKEELYANPDLIMEMIHPLDRNLLEQIKKSTETGCAGNELEHRIVTKDGATRWVRHNCRPIYDSNEKFLGLRGSMTDITDKKQLADQVSHLVLHDMLTGLPNRSLFTDRLSVALTHDVRHKGGLLPVLFFGLDRFKVINETLGHERGDHLLVMVTKKISDILNPDDTLCRFGGDIFAFILSGRESKHEAVTMAYRILAAVSDPFALAGQQISITGSIGIVMAPQDGTDPETLLKNAETAMYEAKRNGKNCFRFYSSDMNAQAVEMLKLDSCMPQSLACGDFFLQFQPQLDIVTAKVCGVEALCRWRHPEMGMIPPNRFIPLAEESGFIIKLGEWILRTACAQSATWRQHGIPPIRVAVNISAKQFEQPDFIDLVSSALADSGLPADLLELELTESLLVSNEQHTLQKLLALKSMGVHLAIDDFGTGYSSFSYLKHFPLNRLKIDQSFVRDIITDPDDAAIIEAIIVMAHVLKLKVIAEGVETVEQLAFLQDHGCDEMQGYYLSKPLVERDLISFINAYGVEKEEDGDKSQGP